MSYLLIKQVGILFSGKKLTHLQRQVCAHILQGIQRETIRLKEEWEAALVSGVDISQDFSSSRVSDSYWFELLSQVRFRRIRTDFCLKCSVHGDGLVVDVEGRERLDH